MSAPPRFCRRPALLCEVFLILASGLLPRGAFAQNAISTGTRAGFRMYYPNSNDWWLDPSQGRFDIRMNGGAPWATLNSQGYLGIGTTNPGALSHVVYNGSGAGPAAKINMTTTSGSWINGAGNALDITVNAPNAWGATALQINNAAANNFPVGANIIVAASGYPGNGVTASVPANSGLSIANSQASGNSGFGAITTGVGFLAQGNHNYGFVSERIQSADSFDSDLAFLRSRGTDASVNGNRAAVAAGDSVGRLNFKGYAAYNTTLNAAQIESRVSGTIDAAHLSGDLRFSVNNNSTALAEAARILANGNVGVGTTSPGAKLEVAGGVKISGTGNGLTFPDNSVQTTAATGGNLWSASGSNAYLTNTSGNVGLGITNPGTNRLYVSLTSDTSAALQVDGYGGNSGLSKTAVISGNIDNGLAAGDTRALLSLQHTNPLGGNPSGRAIEVKGSNGSESTARDVFYIRANGSGFFNGSVGIGTSSPGKPLEVSVGAAGASALAGVQLSRTDAVVGGGAMIKALNQTLFGGVTEGAPGEGFQIRDNSGGVKLEVGTYGGNNGNVTIGTDTNKGTLFINNGAIGSSIVNSIYLNSTDQTVGSGAMIVQNNTHFGGIVTGAPGSAFVVADYLNNAKLFVGTYGGSAGYVGIGTTNPGAALDVNGTVRAASFSGPLTTTGNVNTSAAYEIAGSTVLSVNGTQNVFVGASAGASNTSGYRNTFVGFSAGGANTAGGWNTFVGYGAGNSNTTASSNVFLGDSAGANTTTGASNVFVGQGAGQANTTGWANAFVGYPVGQANTTGFQNVFMGYFTGNNNTTGSYNVFLGPNAGQYNTTGQTNVFMGYYAGNGNSDGANNVALGAVAGQNNTHGSNNTSVGASAGATNTTGSNNIAVGYSAGSIYNHTGSSNTIIGVQAGFSSPEGQGGNVFLGYQAGYSETGSNKLYIGNTLIYGDFVAGNVGIGTTNATAKLTIGGVGGTDGIRFPDGTFQKTAVTGGNIWSASGSNAYLTNTGGSVGIGTTNPATNLDVAGVARGVSFAANGWNSTGLSGTHLFAGVYQSTADIIAYNYPSGPYKDLALQNNAVYIQSGGNVGIGTTAPLFPLSVNGAVTIGTGTFTFPQALNIQGNNLTGNFAVGILMNDFAVPGAAWEIKPQGSNTTKLFRIIDYANNADRLDIDANGNVGIGTASPGGALQVASAGGIPLILSTGTAASQEVMRVAANGSVGVGLTNPSRPLVVLSAGAGGINGYDPTAGGASIFGRSEGGANYGVGVAGYASNPQGGGVAGYAGGDHGAGVVGYCVGNLCAAIAGHTTSTMSYSGYFTGQVGISSGVALGDYAPLYFPPAQGLIVSGNVGIGTPIPAYQLHVVGSVAANAYYYLSDARLKTDVSPLENSLEKLQRLRGVSFRWKDPSNGKGPEIGLLAQDVEKAFPELVGANAEGIKSVQYGNLVAPLIEAVKALKGENDKQQAQINELQSQVEEMKAALGRKPSR